MDQTPQAETISEPVTAPKKPRARRMKADGLAKEVERQMLENAKDVLQKKWNAVKSALDKNERWACELVARQFEGDKGPGGVSILSQTLNVAGGTQEGGAKGIESIIRKLEVRDSLRVMPEPTPVKRIDQDVIDVE